jgi:hypothetical protein
VSDVDALPAAQELLDGPRATAIMDPDLVIHAANKEFLHTVGRTAEDLLARQFFDAFPDNPDETDPHDGVERLTASVGSVLSTGRRHHMVLQRYDLPDPARPGAFVRKYWSPSNQPIMTGGEIVGIALQTAEVYSPRREVVAVLERCRDILADEEGVDSEAAEQLRDGLLFGIREFDSLGRRIGHLERALTSRATIDQAKGILMAERRVTPEEAFDILVRMSNESHVPLREVAKALVYDARAQDTDGISLSG